MSLPKAPGCRFARANPVDVAAQRVDLAVVGDHGDTDVRRSQSGRCSSRNVSVRSSRSPSAIREVRLTGRVGAVTLPVDERLSPRSSGSLSPGRLLGDPSDHVEAPLRSASRSPSKSGAAPTKELAHHRSEEAGMRTRLTLFHGMSRQPSTTCPSAETVASSSCSSSWRRCASCGRKHTWPGVSRGPETDRRPEECVRKLGLGVRRPSPVSASAPAAPRCSRCSLAAQRLRDRFVAAHAVELRHECDSAGVVLNAGS